LGGRHSPRGVISQRFAKVFLGREVTNVPKSIHFFPKKVTTKKKCNKTLPSGKQGKNALTSVRFFLTEKKKSWRHHFGWGVTAIFAFRETLRKYFVISI
jgi:hypothetical protein